MNTKLAKKFWVHRVAIVTFLISSLSPFQTASAGMPGSPTGGTTSVQPTQPVVQAVAPSPTPAPDPLQDAIARARSMPNRRQIFLTPTGGGSVLVTDSGLVEIIERGPNGIVTTTLIFPKSPDIKEEKIVTVTGPNGTTTTTYYVGGGNLEVVQSPNGTVTSTLTGANGNVASIEIRRPDGSSTQTLISGNTKTVIQTNPDGTQTQEITTTDPETGALIDIFTDINGIITTTVTHPSGSKIIVTVKPDGTWTVIATHPDGTVDESLSIIAAALAEAGVSGEDAVAFLGYLLNQPLLAVILAWIIRALQALG